MLAAGAGPDQAVAVGIEIVFRVVAMDEDRGGEGVDERAVDPGGVQQLKLAERVTPSSSGSSDPRPLPQRPQRLGTTPGELTGTTA